MLCSDEVSPCQVMSWPALIKGDRREAPGQLSCKHTVQYNADSRQTSITVGSRAATTYTAHTQLRPPIYMVRGIPTADVRESAITCTKPQHRNLSAQSCALDLGYTMHVARVCVNQRAVPRLCMRRETKLAAGHVVLR